MPRLLFSEYTRSFFAETYNTIVILAVQAMGMTTDGAFHIVKASKLRHTTHHISRSQHYERILLDTTYSPTSEPVRATAEVHLREAA